MDESYGCIEVDLFPREVNDPNHPEAARFREILENVAEEYACRLLFFDVREGTVVFSFDNDELTASIVKTLQHDSGSHP